MISAKTFDKMIREAQEHRQNVRGWQFAVSPDVGRKMSMYKGFRVVSLDSLAHDNVRFAPRGKVEAWKEQEGQS